MAARFTHAQLVSPTASLAPPFPFRCEHRIRRPINEMVVEPFALAGDSFELEAEPLGDRPTPKIFNRAIKDDTIEPKCAKRMIDDRPAGAGHQPTSLVGRIEPIPQLDLSIGMIDRMQSDRADEDIPHKDAALERAVRSEPPKRIADELLLVANAADIIHPRKPLAQPRAIAFDDVENFFGVVGL